MANFSPLKRYIAYCIDQMISSHSLQPPFLDVGCGTGDYSHHLAKRGWHGKAIDYSVVAIECARQKLESLPQINVERLSLFDEIGSYRTVLILDVLEHIENDQEVLEKISSLLQRGGFAVIGVPYNPLEWRWDDDFYGHVRRYTQADLSNKLLAVGLTPVVYWDISFPFFWFLRRLYTRLKEPPINLVDDAETRTKLSTAQNAWSIPIVAPVLEMTELLWWPMYWMQFGLFRKQLKRGNAMLVLAQRKL
jgi:SAM-dependent methyltransferase